MLIVQPSTRAGRPRRRRPRCPAARSSSIGEREWAAISPVGGGRRPRRGGHVAGRPGPAAVHGRHERAGRRARCSPTARCGPTSSCCSRSPIRRPSPTTTSCWSCCRCSTSTASTPRSGSPSPPVRPACSSDRFDPVESLAAHHALARHDDRRCPRDVPGVVRDRPALREAMSTVRMLSSGGSPLPVRVFESFAELTGLRIYEGYGMTETAPVVATTLVSGNPKAGLGRPSAARARGPAGRRGRRGGRRGRSRRGLGARPVGVPGLLARRRRRPGRRGLVPVRATSRYADDDGDLHLVDRRREVILVNGFNVYPREIELGHRRPRRRRGGRRWSASRTTPPARPSRRSSSLAAGRP